MVHVQGRVKILGRISMVRIESLAFSRMDLSGPKRDIL